MQPSVYDKISRSQISTGFLIESWRKENEAFSLIFTTEKPTQINGCHLSNISNYVKKWATFSNHCPTPITDAKGKTQTPKFMKNKKNRDLQNA